MGARTGVRRTLTPRSFTALFSGQFLIPEIPVLSCREGKRSYNTLPFFRQHLGAAR